MSSICWYGSTKPNGLNSEGEKLWRNIIKPLSPKLPNEYLYLDNAKELDEFHWGMHFYSVTEYKKFSRERERFRAYHSITTEDKLDVEKLIEVVANLQLKIQEQEEEIEYLKYHRN